MPLDHRHRAALSAFAILLLAYALILDEDSLAQHKRHARALDKAASFHRALLSLRYGVREEAQLRLEKWTQAQLEGFGVDYSRPRMVAHTVPPSPPRAGEGGGDVDVEGKLGRGRRGDGDAGMGDKAWSDVDVLCAFGKDIIADLDRGKGEAGRFDMNALLGFVEELVGGSKGGAGARLGTLGRPLVVRGGGAVVRRRRKGGLGIIELAEKVAAWSKEGAGARAGPAGGLPVVRGGEGDGGLEPAPRLRKRRVGEARMGPVSRFDVDALRALSGDGGAGRVEGAVAQAGPVGRPTVLPSIEVDEGPVVKRRRGGELRGKWVK